MFARRKTPRPRNRNLVVPILSSLLNLPNFKPANLPSLFCVSSFPATLTGHRQLAENTTALSPAFATLTARVKVNPFVCHSYRKHPGVPNLRHNVRSVRRGTTCRALFPFLVRELAASRERGLVHVVVHGEDVVEALLVGINVNHPAEDDGVETATGVGAGVFGGDGAVQAELGPVRAAELIAWRHAEIRVQVPHGDAEWNASVQLVFGGALGHGVHGANEFVTGRGFFVQQGSGTRGIERERLQEAVAIACEVILGLRDIRQKDFEAVIERDVVVPVFFDPRAKLSDDFIGALHVFGSFRAHRGHEHVLAVRIGMAGRHVRNSGFFAGLRIVHIHAGHIFGLRGWRWWRGLLGRRRLRGGRVVAGHGDQEYCNDKDGAENHGGFGGEMKQRSTRGHYHSPQSIIRKELDENFSDGVAWFLGQDCTEGQEGRSKEVTK